MVATSDPLDERLLSQAALTSSNETLESLCARFASTFVAVEIREGRLEGFLDKLLSRLNEAESGAVIVADSLEVGERQDDTSHCLETPNEDKMPPSSSVSLGALAERHRIRRRTLLQHSALLELLELPALMDACLRAGLYDDALAVAAFGNLLERRHSVHARMLESGNYKQSSEGIVGGGERVIQIVVSNLRSREKDLRDHLVSRLRGDITMSQCLEIVTALRRLNGVELERRRSRLFSQVEMLSNDSKGRDKHFRSSDVHAKEKKLEQAHATMELRLMVEFFEARDIWLCNGTGMMLVHDLPVSTSSQDREMVIDSFSEEESGRRSELILNMIDLNRTRTFEIATQFLAIFCGNVSQALSSRGNPFQLLSMWLLRRTNAFVSDLERDLSLLTDAASLRDILDASIFFSTSMGRIGSEFQSLLPPIFHRRLTKFVVKKWADGVSTMSETLRLCREAGVAGPLMSTASTNESDLNPSQHARSSPAEILSPPRRLLALPPLARFVNSFLDGLNELRRCLLPGSKGPLVSSSLVVFSEVESLLVANERAVLKPGLRGDATRLRYAASETKKEFVGCVRPFLIVTLRHAIGDLDARDFSEEGGSKQTDRDELEDE